MYADEKLVRLWYFLDAFQKIATVNADKRLTSSVRTLRL
jgi:hypothetical protein